jgi:hypothetical protein
MSAFIAIRWAKKLKNLPQPEICRLADTGTEMELGGMEVDLPKNVMSFTP